MDATDPRLPLHPNLGYYRKRAKELKRAIAAQEAAALARLRSQHPRPPAPADVSLGDAQLVLAREHGFATWAEFKRAVEQAPPGAPPGARDRLWAALRAGDRDAVAQLLAEDPALAVAPEAAGGLPLVEACDRGHFEIVRLLLDAGADPRAGNPLLAASHPGPHKPAPARDVIELLLARGAPNDAFTHATLGRVEDLRRALPTVDVNAPGPGGGSLLSLAAGNGHVEAVRVLLQAGADPNHVGASGQSIWRHVFLHVWGAEYRAIARLLLDHGVACSFAEACEVGHVATVARLLAADPALKDAAGPGGRPPLESAIINADVELARVLLAAGADDRQGRGRALVDATPRHKENLTGAVFRNCSFKVANFHSNTFKNATFSDVDFSGTSFHNANFTNVRIESAFINNLTIWGIDVVPLIEAERKRRQQAPPDSSE